MSPPSEIRVVELLRPYIDENLLTDDMLSSLRIYLDLIRKWNAHTNLTAIRDPEELVQRQIGESLFAGGLVPLSGTLLDFGSGAGFPGVPLQILRPRLKVTLAESQGKKASFLREAVRTLCLPCEVWAKRVEQMPAGRAFDAVVMRAVDATEAMLPIAADRVGLHGALISFNAGGRPHELAGWQLDAEAEIPLSMGQISRLKRL